LSSSMRDVGDVRGLFKVHIAWIECVIGNSLSQRVFVRVT
jgi:hypothetical protein